MPRFGFEPTIAVFDRAKTVRILDRAATEIDSRSHCSNEIFILIAETYILLPYIHAVFHFLYVFRT
jgi:hypothetical protein